MVEQYEAATREQKIVRYARSIFYLLPVLVLGAACSEIPDWMGGSPPMIKRAPGERENVVSGAGSLTPDAAVQDVSVEVPEQTNIVQWRTMNEAMVTGHIGLHGVTHEQYATVGGGNEFTRTVNSPPIVAGGTVFAMDAAGIVSAHDESDITKVKWTNGNGRPNSMKDVLGGGLAFSDGVVYATNGAGNLRALDAATGAVKWSISVGAPVRGAPAIDGSTVIVLSADNQTLAYDATNGAPKWEHRGIRESAGYFSITAPVVSDGIVIATYSSGEMFAIRAESGSVLWNDTLAGSVRTKAAAIFNGIDANPIVQDGVVVVTSASGEMQASALLNGRPLWQQRIGAHATPWSAGNVLYVLSDTHDVAAVLKRDGAVRWSTSMLQRDSRDTAKDVTPPLYGPILSANTVLVVDGNGVLTSFKPTTGEKIGTFELAEGIVTAPIIANGAMYVLTREGRLYKYY
ncbi:MAG: PQQ-binding-like beta-propeller repeat protein [Rickettsiales bacterium]